MKQITIELIKIVAINLLSVIKVRINCETMIIKNTNKKIYYQQE